MSISQIKRRFEQFEAYLGRDVQGLGKLKALKDAVNELRTSLAQSEAKAAQHAATSENLELELRRLKSEKTALDAEIHRLKQISANLERELRCTKLASVPDVTETKAATSSSELDVKAALKRLRKRLKYCPKPTRISGELATQHFPGCKSRWVSAYCRESIADGWSADALWTLGAAVAVLASARGVAVIETTKRMHDESVYDPDSDESAYRPASLWYMKNNIDVVALSQEAHRDCPVGPEKSPAYVEHNHIIVPMAIK